MGKGNDKSIDNGDNNQEIDTRGQDDRDDAHPHQTRGRRAEAQRRRLSDRRPKRSTNLFHGSIMTFSFFTEHLKMERNICDSNSTKNKTRLVILSSVGEGLRPRDVQGRAFFQCLKSHPKGAFRFFLFLIYSNALYVDCFGNRKRD